MTKSSYISEIEKAVAIIKILSNGNRYAIMKTLFNAKRDLCVHELSETVGISQSATSHCLAYLEARGVVTYVRMGKTKCYQPTDTLFARKIHKVIKIL